MFYMHVYYVIIVGVRKMCPKKSESEFSTGLNNNNNNNNKVFFWSFRLPVEIKGANTYEFLRHPI